MKPISFVAESVVDAVGQIRSRLGPDAVVIKVRKLRSLGLLRFWERPRIEVLAWLPDSTQHPPDDSHKPEGNLTATLDGDDERNSAYPSPGFEWETPFFRASSRTTNRFAMPGSRFGEWQSPPLLERMGLTPLNTERLMEYLRLENMGGAPDSLRGELRAVQNCLRKLWKPFNGESQGPRVLIGPPGAGKTTVLCKMLTNAILLEGASARVWRLDVPRANTGEILGVHCEILNVPVERSWRADFPRKEQYQFVDLPGIEVSDALSLAGLKSVIKQMEIGSLSLVLNAAYDIDLLQAHVRAFAHLPVTDLIFTHLDEERRWSRLLNFVIGTKLPISFLSAGQNVPGQLVRATAFNLLPPEMNSLWEESDPQFCGNSCAT